ncbi:MAG: hypothetical protein EXX96DRAFT_584232 [Benjaminiella poitrasii]|nr:MAG: hypothetical protein EXX96DRAFT_584232 [Benjaminiella poitrasii]
MRVKINTITPLPKYQCWYSIPTKIESQTIHQLRQTMTKQLKLNHDAALLNLSIDGFTLLPQLKIQDLVRDGDLINIKIESTKQLQAKKRKTVVELDKNEKNERVLKKPKKEDKKTKEKSVKKKELEKEKKKSKEDKKNKSLKKKEKRIKSTEQEKLVVGSEKKKKIETKQKSPPFEGKNKTKKRNLRRKLVMKSRKMQNEARSQQNKTTVVSVPAVKQPTKNVDKKVAPTTEEQSPTLPVSLLKKNKNKKKDHLKKGKAAQQESSASHVHFEEAPPPTIQQENESYYNDLSNDLQEQEEVDNNNLYGRAFVTFAESQPSRRSTKDNHFTTYEYPVNKMPSLFYADKPEHDENENENADNITTEELRHIEEQDVEKTAVAEAELPAIIVNYDECPDANFENNIPSIGDHLAIKTLELTANYTPEISDWKQVILKEIDLPSTITIEYKEGFRKESTKGGKFDINRKKRDDDDEYYYEEQIEEEEEKEEEDHIVTFNVTDIFAVKNMSKK